MSKCLYFQQIYVKIGLLSGHIIEFIKYVAYDFKLLYNSLSVNS